MPHKLKIGDIVRVNYSYKCKWPTGSVPNDNKLFRIISVAYESSDGLRVNVENVLDPAEPIAGGNPFWDGFLELDEFMTAVHKAKTEAEHAKTIPSR